jgi:hypothetical protein
MALNRREFLASAAAVPPALTLKSEDDFVPLFDGVSLRGWNVEEGPESALFVSEGAIVASKSSNYPAWLRSDRRYENFDFRCEFYIRGWIDGGIYIHAPRHGRATWAGMQIKIFHQQDEVAKSNSMGAVFPLVAPSKVNVKGEGNWNSLRILMDWPRLQVWVNGEQVQDLDVGSNPELRHRFKKGYLGLVGLSYPIRFRNLKIRELPDREALEDLYVTDSDFEKWFLSESSEQVPGRFEPLGGVLRASGLGHLATKEKFRDFELSLYVRGPKEHNGGVLVRSSGRGLPDPRHYEIQLHSVADAHYPTGSLYHYKRSTYPRIEDEKWFPLQIRFQDRHCLVRVNGDTVLQYEGLKLLEPGFIELQAHQAGSWLEFKEIRIKQL